MFIQTEKTVNPQELKFLPGQPVLKSGTLHFTGADQAQASPLARRLFEIEGVQEIALASDAITIRKTPDLEWQFLKPLILGVIMDHLSAALPVVEEAEPEFDLGIEEDAADAETIAELHRLIDERVHPAVARDGGAVEYMGYKEGVLYLKFSGNAATLRPGIENMLGHFVPALKKVVDYREAIPKPGLETSDAQKIQQLLDDKINPSVAAHGGHISLIDVQEDTAFIRLEGGCHGCGMADVTLKEGVEKLIVQEVPAISRVLDTTDHAGGTNPYFQPA